MSFLDDLPTLRNQRLDKQAKIMLLNVAKYLKQWKVRQASMYRTDFNVNKAVAEATSVSLTTVKKIMTECKSATNIEDVLKTPSKRRNRKPKIQIDSVTQGLIRQKIDEYYINNKVPTIRKILKELKDAGILNCGREYLRKYLHSNGYRLQNKRVESKKNAGKLTEPTRNVKTTRATSDVQISQPNLGPVLPESSDDANFGIIHL